MKITYRPEIDGLRAIAVGAVILYHGQIKIFGYELFKGGFIGVDIFFVISGYLITSIILKELILSGTFSFKHFYERRIRRILPALLFVMLISIPFAWTYLFPNSFIDFSKSILYSIGFSSNFYFHYSGQIYGDESGLFKPFLHTWSLAVEEQYYIIFPLVLLITFRYARKHLLTVLIIILFASLQIADWGSRNYSSATFYFFYTRIWELLAGSILAYFEIIKGQKTKKQVYNFIFQILGLILIGHSILFFSDKMFHPSFYTLSPIIGTCFIIWFSNKDELITKILSTKLFVGIGLISYSLYLWHYPIFVFARIIEFTHGSLFKKFLLVVILFIISILTYFFIERPARNKNYNYKTIINLILVFITVLVIINFISLKTKGYENRSPEILLKNSSEKPFALLKNEDGKLCYQNIEGCKFNTSSTKKVYIIGDSHMGSLTFNLKDRLVDKNYQFITSTLGWCLFYPGMNQIIEKTQKISEKCNNNYFKKLKQILSNEENSIIIFGGRLPLYLTNKYFDNQEGGVEGLKLGFKYAPSDISSKYNSIEESLRNEILLLSKKNKIILVYPIPEVGWDVRKKIFITNNNIFFKKSNLNDITTSYKVYKDRTKSSFMLLDTINNNNIYRVYPHKLFCNKIHKNRCITHNDKDIFYVDDDHPSIKGAELINDLIMKEIAKINN